MWPEYEKIGLLGRGSFGQVKKVRRLKDQKVFACKIILANGSKDSSQDLENEYLILRQLNHPNIVRYVDYRTTQIDHSTIGLSRLSIKLGIFMEFCSQGSLQDLIDEARRSQTSFDESLIWKVVSQLALALRYCHYGIGSEGIAPSVRRHTVLHRDIKPANVLVSSRSASEITVKLADFGIAKLLDPESPPETYAGTALYQPPEISRASSRGIFWTKSCDIFSFACTMYTFCTLTPPFPYRMEENETCPDIPSSYTPRLNDCILRCLSFHPETRYDAFDIIEICERAQGISKPSRIATGEPAVADHTITASNIRTSLQTVVRKPTASPSTKLTEVVLQEKLQKLSVTQISHVSAQRDHVRSPAELEFARIVAEFEKLIEDSDPKLFRIICTIKDVQRKRDAYFHTDWTLASAEVVCEMLNTGLVAISEDTVLLLADTAEKMGKISTEKYLRGEFESSRGNYASAATLLRQAQRIHGQEYGVDHPSLEPILFNLSVALHDCPADAVRVANELLNIVEKTYGKEHERCVMSLICLALAEIFNESNADAERNVTHALHIASKTLGQDDWQVALGNFVLGSCFLKQDRWSEAEMKLDIAVRTFTAVAGVQYHLTASASHLLGRVRMKQSRNEEGIADLEFARNYYETYYGKSHETLAEIYFDLGFIYFSLGDYAEAEVRYERAGEAGVNHDHTGLSILWLGRVYYKQSKYVRSVQQFELARQIFESVHGQDDKLVAEALIRSGITRFFQGKYAEAEQDLNLAQQINGKVYTPGTTSKEIAKSSFWLGRIKFIQGSHAEAEPLLDHARHANILVHGADHAYTAISLFWLGRVQFSIKKLFDAEDNLELAGQIFEKGNSGGTRQSADCLFWLGRAKFERSKYPKAAHYFQLAQKIYQRLPNGDDNDSAISFYWRARALFEDKQYQAARFEMVQAQQVYIKISGEHHEDAKNCAAWLSYIDNMEPARQGAP